ncbi:Os08g0497200 [Oryza sativa Japonica Group]|uniref:Uncharacterized protein n=2 Tax=Oryza sativa subsp. japonica TaxID=39947 RepID=A0A0P0XH76_ORYSJ|nr:hypothetical protein [Oryza sativa Japonica Group]BAD10138.1 hypothetical protein [Oryza sativa Japonica Group]BAT06075.1 Os08g0497200 [Oryza sativa Japonica Group]
MWKTAAPDRRSSDWRRVGGQLGAERRSQWREAGLAREARPMEEVSTAREVLPAATEAGLAREARPAVAVEEATSERGGAAGGCGAVFGARRLAGGGRRCSSPTCRQRLSGGGASVR